MQRSQATPPAERPPPKYTGGALRQHLQEYNEEAIRQGLPALPIELTPEQDQRLVAEGVLPPMAPAAPTPNISPQALEQATAGALIEGLPPELGNLRLEDLSTEELQLLLQQ